MYEQVLAFLAFATIGAAMSAYGFQELRLLRKFAELPKTTIRAAATGPVKISGTVECQDPIISQITKEECVYYETTIKSSQSAYFKEKAFTKFVLKDATGSIRIEPKGSRFAVSQYHDYQFEKEQIIPVGEHITVCGNLQNEKYTDIVKCKGLMIISSKEESITKKEFRRGVTFFFITGIVITTVSGILAVVRSLGS